ncbi:two component response regulator KdpE [Novosphingobium sp. Rr 2-17]|nr:two component response regulator KdpE [Novosphingobium sp. Rr 2-17]
MEAGAPPAAGIGLVLASGDSTGWMQIVSSLSSESRRLVLILGIEDPDQRASLLRMGFGDVIGHDIDMVELDARADRVAQLVRWLPRRRKLGDLQLDLMAREAYFRGTPLNLNPREFALTWRLSDTPNEAVNKQALIRDVWQMGFVPETNSIAVHMSRLRRKLSFVGLDGIIETVSLGGYRLVAPKEVFADISENYDPVLSPALEMLPEMPTPAALQLWKH